VSQTGYFGVVVPDRDFWQCFFVDDNYRESALDMIRRVRADKALATGSKVISRLNIPISDQTLVGSFCATVVEAALAETGHYTQTAIDNPNGVIATVGYAIREVIGRPYFWIEARSTSAGTFTTIQPIHVSTIEQARIFIDGMPIVRSIKRRLLRKMEQMPPEREGQHRVANMRGAKKKDEGRRFSAVDEMVARINAETRKR
jgi:hypothetical protein